MTDRDTTQSMTPKNTNEDFGVFEQREIREMPALPEITKQARQQVTA